MGLEGRRLTLLLAASAGLHVALFVYLGRLAKEVPRVVSVTRSPVKVRVALGTPPPPKPAAVAKSGGARKSRSGSARPPTQSPAPAGRDRPRASDLLPGADYAFRPSADRGATGPAPQGARNASVEIAGTLDIPLFFRAKNAAAKATAKIVQDGDRAWIFDYVDGDPHLRAIIFEALRESQNRAAVADLLRELNSAELTISLRQETVVTPDPAAPFRESVRLEGTKLVVERWYFQAPLPTPAAAEAAALLSLTLPDEEADRGRLRDRMQLKRLESSPAFVSPIRRRRP